mmetsp:Transcript_73473/g.192689  ORF Transcript_73473/g.192689 Transcript_73473/m.192689 type:complete len:635 (-) Transcript_73473:164-2068(-)
MTLAATPRRLSQAGAAAPGTAPGTPRARRLSRADAAPPTPTGRQLSKANSDPPSPQKVSNPIQDAADVQKALLARNPLGLLPCEPNEVGLDASVMEEHRRRNRWQESLGVLPGVAECVISGDRIAYLDLMGSADVERGTPVRPSTLFRCFSMTKPITAVGLMRLVEAKQVGLDDPVSRYIPSFQSMTVVRREHAQEMDLKPEHLEPNRTPITIRHLLTHTSGLAYGPDRVSPSVPLKANGAEESSYLPLVEAVDDGSIRTLAEFCDELAKLPLRFRPGSQWMYSHGVDVVGRIIEVVSGRPLDAFLREEVFQPLGMTRTQFFVGHHRARDLAAMYLAEKDVPAATRLQGKGKNKAVPSKDEDFTASLKRVDGQLPEESRWCKSGRRLIAGGGIMGSCAGGLVSCLNDMALFVSMLANQGRAISGAQLLQRSTVSALWRDWLALASVVGHRHGRMKKLPGWPNGPRIGWTPLGHVRRSDKCLYMGGWSTNWAIYPKTRLATISMSQSLVYFDVPGWVARKDELDSAVEFGVANHRRRLSQLLRHRQTRRAAQEAKRLTQRNWKLKVGAHSLSRALRKAVSKEPVGALRAVAVGRPRGLGNATLARAREKAAAAARRRSGAHMSPVEPQPKRRRST